LHGAVVGNAENLLKPFELSLRHFQRSSKEGLTFEVKNLFLPYAGWGIVQNLFQIGVFLSQFEENRHNRQISLSVGVNEMGFKGVMFTVYGLKVFKLNF